ncbi:MAG: hypothetical protein H0U62_02085 [Actinobacteria bacterium]|nr:hypothetical protein [Actinomycetota bacterium]
MRALTRLVEAVAANGDHERATRLTGEAEALTTQITNPEQRVRALTRLVEAVAASGDHERVEAFTTIPEWGAAEALTRLVEAVAANADHERAEALTTQITDPE